MYIVDLFLQNFLFRLSILFILGLIIGSFLNVVIYRLPLILKRKWQQDCVDMLNLDTNDTSFNTQESSTNNCYVNNDIPSTFNLAHPPSHCPNCAAKIPYWANIPLIGYFLVKRVCVSCRHKISPQYPIVELMTAVLYACAGFLVTDSLVLLCYLVFISFVVCLIVIDFNTFLLPDELTILLLWLGLLVNIRGIIAPNITAAVIGAILGYMSLWLLYWVFKLITKREGMGYGDFKFLAAILAWFGYAAFIPILLIAPMLAIIYFIVLRLLYKLKLDQPIPFGPFLGIAALVVLCINKTSMLEYFVLTGVV